MTSSSGDEIYFRRYIYEKIYDKNPSYHVTNVAHNSVISC